MFARFRKLRALCFDAYLRHGCWFLRISLVIEVSSSFLCLCLQVASPLSRCLLVLCLPNDLTRSCVMFACVQVGSALSRCLHARHLFCPAVFSCVLFSRSKIASPLARCLPAPPLPFPGTFLWSVSSLALSNVLCSPLLVVCSSLWLHLGSSPWLNSFSGSWVLSVSFSFSFVHASLSFSRLLLRSA